MNRIKCVCNPANELRLSGRKSPLAMGFVICSLLLLSIYADRALAEEKAFTDWKRFAVGINYPGANIRVNFRNNFAAEVKAQYMDDIFVIGPRIYSFLGAQGKPLKFFLGGEMDYLSFKGEVSKGTGYALEGFFGLEYFLSKRISFQADIGPAYISVTDADTSLNSGGLQFVINSGINFHF